VAHKPSCAARIRAAAGAADRSADTVVAAIAACCGVSRLRAHRLGRGWTLRQAVDELVEMCGAQGLPHPSVDLDQLRAWETSPRRPRAQTVDLLCRLYRTDAHGLGLSGNYRPADEEGGEHLLPAVVRPAAPSEQHPADGQVPGVDPLDRLVDAVRRTVEHTMAQTTVSATQLEVLDDRMFELRRLYVFTPPTEMLGQLLGDLDEVRRLAQDRQPAHVQVRLSEMTALLATLTADALMKLGRLQQAQRWYGTARTAADDSGNRELRARVRVQAAMLPYYYGPLGRAVELADQARLLNRGRPTATGAFATAALARALARQGDAEAARTAIRQAQDLFERCSEGTADVDDAWAFPTRRLYLYLSGAFTYLGDTVRARQVQAQALALYPDRTGIDPALLHLEEAMCLVHDHSVSEACQLAGDTYLRVPQAHRTTILGSRAHDVIDILPPGVRSARAVRELGEILALPARTI
jgi:tetratricopeptide (TPR) repeat protein